MSIKNRKGIYIWFSSDNFPEHTLPDQILDAVPELYELNRYVRIRKWYDLGIELKLDNVDLAASKNHTDVYQLWLDEKSLQATRRNLIDALRAIGQNRVVDKYIAYLKTIKMVSDVVKDNLLNIFLKLHFKIDSYFNQFVVTILCCMHVYKIY